MRYCLFCREAFPDDPAKCPYCDGELVDKLPDPDADQGDIDREEGARERGERENDESGGSPLVEVAVVDKEDDLRAAVEVFKQHGTGFEIEEVDRAQVKMIGGRAWRLLVPGDEAEAAFFHLVEEAPGIFPREMREEFARERPPEEDKGAEAAAKIPAMLEAKTPAVNPVDLARAIVEGFASRNSPAVSHAKYALAVHGREVAPLLAGIVAEAISAGGEGAVSVLFNALEILETIGYGQAIESIEPLYASGTPQVRARAAYAAGRLGNPEAVDGLLDLLEDEDEEVRYEASESIWRLSGLDFEYDPYAPVDKEREHVQALRAEWSRHHGHDHVRNRRSVPDLLGGEAGEEESKG
jgi:hypothetical protein